MLWSVLPVKLCLLLASKLSRHLVVWPVNLPALHWANNRINSITEHTWRKSTVEFKGSVSLPQFIFTTYLLLEFIHTIFSFQFFSFFYYSSKYITYINHFWNQELISLNVAFYLLRSRTIWTSINQWFSVLSLHTETTSKRTFIPNTFY